MKSKVIAIIAVSLFIGQIMCQNAFASSPYDGEYVHVTVECEGENWRVYISEFDETYEFPLNYIYIDLPHLTEQYPAMNLEEIKSTDSKLYNVCRYVSLYHNTSQLNIGDYIWLNGTLFQNGTNFNLANFHGGWGSIILSDNNSDYFQACPSNLPTYEKPITWLAIMYIMLTLAVTSAGLFFYLRRKRGPSPREHLGGWLSILISILSFAWIFNPSTSLLFLGIFSCVIAIFIGIGSTIRGNERGLIGIGLALFHYAIISYIFWI